MSPLSWNLILALVWAAITGNFSGANLLVGFGLGYLILGFALRDVPDFARYREKMPRVLMLLTHFLRDLLVSNLRVAYDVLTPTHYMRPAVVAVPLRAKTDGAITIRPEGQGPEALVQVDQLKLVNPETHNLYKAANGNLYGRDFAVFAVAEGVQVNSGFVESSNVNAINELTEILSLARQFELEVRMMKVAETNDEASSQLLRIG